MSKMIGVKSGINWNHAPKEATHTRSDGLGWYHLDSNGGLYLISNVYGITLSSFDSVEEFNNLRIAKLISKEEDLQMNIKTKVVRGVEDLELGLFLKDDSDNIVVVTRNCGKVSGKSFYTCCNTGNGLVAQNGAGEAFYNNFTSWSYTYSGEYTPIVKETEAEKKIKELEATIALAKKQLEEYKEMK